MSRVLVALVVSLTCHPDSVFASSTSTLRGSRTGSEAEVANASAAASQSRTSLRGVAYGALPCSPNAPCRSVGLPSEDVVQEGYEPQWGSKGRNDLGTIKALGANAVRLYHSMGTGSQQSHRKFLDRAEELGLNVMPGLHSNEARLCPDFDCFIYTKRAMELAFKQGYRSGNQWHPAVSTLILLNEPDFFENDASCKPKGPWCRVKAAVSAMDGVLTAEREAGLVHADRLKLTITWSFAMRTSIDGKVNGPGTFGFQDMIAVTDDPSIVKYTPQTPLTDLKKAYSERWINGLNTQAPWSFVNEYVSQHYGPFGSMPWFIGEYGANGQTEEVIRADLQSIDEAAKRGKEFLGAAVFQFQTAYEKGGSEKNFGLFSLGGTRLGETGEVCDDKALCRRWPVFCLKAELPWLPGKMGMRAQAVAQAWKVASSGSSNRVEPSSLMTTTAFSQFSGFC